MINIEEHLKLVHKVLTKFHLKNCEYDDLFQEGCIGLIKASKRFDENKKIQFSTYATYCIRNQVLQAFKEDGWYLGTQVERMKGMALGPVFLETKLDANTTYYDFLKDDENIEENVLNKIDAYRALSTKSLTKKEKTVISLYYFENYRVLDIAKILGCSRQTVCNIKNRALEKMKHNLEKGVRS